MAAVCKKCGKAHARLCLGCFTVRYCDKECQRADWKTHKPECDMAANARELEKEQKDMREAFSAKPFPDFKTMASEILTWGGEKNKGVTMKWWSEYNEAHHERLRTMYDSCLDKVTCEVAGKAINAAGGFEAMQACFYVLANWSGTPFISRVKTFWDGIGQWKH